MKCKYCGTELSDNVTSCIECGGLLDKTQVSIMVRRESFYSEFRWKVLGHPFLWFFYLNKETSSVKILIDGKSENQKYLTLKPQKEPYKVELKPGYHEIIFINENADNQNNVNNIMRVTAGTALGTMVNSMTGGGGIDTFNSVMETTKKSKVGYGYAAFTVQSGDTYKLICRPTRKGDVRIWECER